MFLSRLLDLTGAIGYEKVDLGSCLLSERPTLALHREDSEPLPESLAFLSTVSGTFHEDIVKSGQKENALRARLKWDLTERGWELKPRPGGREGRGSSQGPGTGAEERSLSEQG